MEEKVILDVKIDNTEAVKNIADLKAKIDELRKAQSEEEKQNGKNTAEYVRMGEQIKNLSKQVQEQSKAVQDNVKMSQNAEDSYNKLSAELARLKAAYKAAGSDEDREKILKNLTAVDSKLKELDEQQGVYVRNVGNYPSAFSKVGEAVDKLKHPLKTLKVGLTAISAHPIIAVLGVLVLLIKKIAERFKENGAAMEQLTVAFSAFNGIGVVVNKLIDKLAQGIGWLAEKLMGVADNLGLVTDEMKESQRIAQTELDLQKQARETAKQAADDEMRIAELKAQAADKSKYTAEERLKFLQEANDLEEGIAQRAYDLAKQEYDLQVDKNAQSESSQEELNKENELYIKMVQTQTALFNKQKELNAQMTEARNQATADAQAKLKEVQELAKQALAEGRAIRDQYGLITDQQKLDEELAKLEDALKKGAILQQEYEEIREKIREREQAKKDKEAQEELKKIEELEEKKRQARVKFGLEDDKSEQQNELEQLKQAYNNKLLSEDEYQQALADLREKYRKQELDALQAATKEQEQAAMDALQERYEKAGAALAEWGGKTMDLVGSVFDTISAVEDAQMQKYVEQNEEKKSALQERLDSGLISQEEYDAKVMKLDEEQAKKEKELQLKQAKRQKAMAIMNALLNAAGAIIASLAQSPIAIGVIPNPVGIASLALATATGTAQVAAASATPLPKASRGALLRGKSHAQGGIPIEAEGGEAIINKTATKRYLPLLSAINQSTGGVPLYANGGIPQQVMRQTEQALFNQDQFLQAVASIKPQVAVTDINRGQENMVTLTERRAY